MTARYYGSAVTKKSIREREIRNKKIENVLIKGVKLLVIVDV